MNKKVFCILSLIFTTINTFGYGVKHSTYESYEGIEVVSITPKTDGSFVVNFYNPNSNDGDDGYNYNVNYYSFYWYLSYKGERVSDYNKSTIRCRTTGSSTVFAWPDKIPKGHERFITVQFGKEKQYIQKDRRDDDY